MLNSRDSHPMYFVPVAFGIFGLGLTAFLIPMSWYIGFFSGIALCTVLSSTLFSRFLDMYDLGSGVRSLFSEKPQRSANFFSSSTSWDGLLPIIFPIIAKFLERFSHQKKKSEGVVKQDIGSLFDILNLSTNPQNHDEEKSEQEIENWLLLRASPKLTKDVIEQMKSDGNPFTIRNANNYLQKGKNNLLGTIFKPKSPEKNDTPEENSSDASSSNETPSSGGVEQITERDEVSNQPSTLTQKENEIISNMQDLLSAIFKPRCPKAPSEEEGNETIDVVNSEGMSHSPKKGVIISEDEIVTIDDCDEESVETVCKNEEPSSQVIDMTSFVNDFLKVIFKPQSSEAPSEEEGSPNEKEERPTEKDGPIISEDGLVTINDCDEESVETVCKNEEPSDFLFAQDDTEVM